MAGIVSRFESLRIGIESLRVSPFRTLLAVLGIAAGVASLVAVLAIGAGMEKAARSELERTTSLTTVVARPELSEDVDGVQRPIRHYPVFSVLDARLARAEIADAVGVSLEVIGAAMVEFPGARRQTLVHGTSADADRFMNLDVAVGRYFTDAESRRRSRVVVLSDFLRRAIAPREPLDRLLGRTVVISGEPFEIVGVLSPFVGERTYAAYVPFSRASRLYSGVGPSPAPQLLFRAASLERTEELRAAVRAWSRL